MLLSTKGRYAVMAIVEVAKQGDARPLSLGEIADRLELSLAYLEQLFMKLRRAGLVQSVRGPGGGYVLAREAGGISVSEIMAAVDEPVKMTRCAGESVIGCVATRRCTTHYLWDALGAHIEQFLAAATLADILHGRYAAPAMDFGLSELTAAAEVR
jgi:Rrf2 family transcriptional regulator, iron-sulfur cluster assembly transcription factor